MKRKTPPENEEVKQDGKEEEKEDLYAPEPVKPEYLELPEELKEIDFQADGAAAWSKYAPYNPHRQLPITPLETEPDFSQDSPALCFHVHGIDGRARAATVHFPNGGPPVPTPRFMPVGTKGTLKGVLPDEIAGMKCPIILANTYHLEIQPGTELIDSVFNGLHNFMGGTMPSSDSSETKTDDPQSNSNANSTGKRRQRRLYNLLTDSGGFQMVSLASLSVVTENCVVFKSPYTGKPMMLRPEDSIRCQNDIGADIIMQLDDVISSVSIDDSRFKIATFRTLRWYDRCVKAHRAPERQNLFPIMQGHLDVSKGGLRELCLAGFKHRDQSSNSTKNDGTSKQEQQQEAEEEQEKQDATTTATTRKRRIPGFAIGGLAGGESKEDFWKVVDHACRHLPDDRPRYLMGVGYPLDLVVCTALGVDMYDCVYPTRTARFGVALVDEGQMKLKRHEFAPGNLIQNSNIPIDADCPCEACSRGISRGRLHALLKANNPIAAQLITQHNVTYMMGLVTRMRKAILQKEFPPFVREFMKKHFSDEDNNNGKIPEWVKDALDAAGIPLES
uniref:tRNA-guanine(15) transglycosylase-like domain-containing protein n=1 Tax=Pseudo-nitzschia australis TaxID=44445 RepID=A0A7S4EHR6_9STRA